MSRPPVRDLFGARVWRVRVASRAERTCLDCGETTTDAVCPRCCAEKEISALSTSQVGRRLAPTLSYLRAGEYELS